MEQIISAGSDAAPIKDSDTENFVHDVLEASRERPVIVDFWAEWCGPCKQLTPVLEKLVREKKGKVALIKVDIDRNREIAAQLRIQSIPTVYAFYQGRPMDAFQGAVPESQIRAFIDRLLENSGQGRDGLDEMLEQAEAALNEEDDARAGEIFGGVLKIEPDHPGALGGLALLAVRAGDLAQAGSILGEIDGAHAGHPAVARARAALELAREAGGSGDISELESRIETAPDDHEARFELARSLAARGARNEAAEHLLEIIRRDREWNEGAARQQLLRMFEAEGAASPFTQQWRRRLSSVLFA